MRRLPSRQAGQRQTFLIKGKNNADTFCCHIAEIFQGDPGYLSMSKEPLVHRHKFAD